MFSSELFFFFCKKKTKDAKGSYMFKWKTTTRHKKGGVCSHVLRIPGSRGLAGHAGFPLSPCVSGTSALSPSPAARCSRGLSPHPLSEDFFNRRLSRLAKFIAALLAEGSQLVAGGSTCPGGPSCCHHGTHAEHLPTRVPPFLDQQETAGLARCSFAHLSFLDSFPHHDASEAHRPFCTSSN